MKAPTPHQIWGLNFKSVAQIEPSKTENQFYISMSSTDDGPADSIILFQFSRTQNVVYHWKFRQPILQMHVMLDAGILIVVNKLLEIQKIYNNSYTKL